MNEEEITQQKKRLIRMAQRTLQDTVQALRSFVQRKQWKIESESTNENRIQVYIDDGEHLVPVNCYANGQVQVEGTPNPLKAALEGWCSAWESGENTSTL